MITGPNGPFTNIPPTIETHVEFISDIIQNAESRARGKMMTNGDAATNGIDTTHRSVNHQQSKASRGPVIESMEEAEDEWTALRDELSASNLFRKTDSWIFGANVEGKKPSVLFYFGGLANYRKKLREVADKGYEGFKPFERLVPEAKASV